MYDKLLNFYNTFSLHDALKFNTLLWIIINILPNTKKWEHVKFRCSTFIIILVIYTEFYYLKN